MKDDFGLPALGVFAAASLTLAWLLFQVILPNLYVRSEPTYVTPTIEELPISGECEGDCKDVKG